MINTEDQERVDMLTDLAQGEDRPAVQCGTLSVEEIPHGHGMSTKRGIADGLLEERRYEGNVPNGHDASYWRSVRIGEEQKRQIAALVKE